MSDLHIPEAGCFVKSARLVGPKGFKKVIAYGWVDGVYDFRPDEDFAMVYLILTDHRPFSSYRFGIVISPDDPSPLEHAPIEGECSAITSNCHSTSTHQLKQKEEPSMSDTVTFDKPVNVKVKGEKAMRKNVTLKENGKESVRVLTGKRGRPATLPLDSIERVRVL